MTKYIQRRTGTAYLSKFKLFLAFTNWYQRHIKDVDTILSFMEFLAQNGCSAPSLTSYITAMSHFFKTYDLNDQCLNHRKVYLIIKAVLMNSENKPRYKANFTIPLLHKLVEACDHMSQGHVYKAIFLLAYFGFLRLSNLAPLPLLIQHVNF